MKAITRSGFLVGLALCAICSTGANAGELPTFDRVRVLESPRQIDDARLLNQDGQDFLFSDLQGKVAFVFFGFTNCPDVCPMTMSRWRDLERSGEVDPDQVAFVLISVDGERDTPAVMKEYLLGFSASFLGLTGSPATIKPIAKQFSAAFYKGAHSPDSGHYSVSHSPQAFVLDAAGRLRAEMYEPSTESMAGIIGALLAEGSVENESGQ